MKIIKLTDSEYSDLQAILEVLRSEDETVQQKDSSDYDEQYAKNMESICIKFGLK